MELCIKSISKILTLLGIRGARFTDVRQHRSSVKRNIVSPGSGTQTHQNKFFLKTKIQFYTSQRIIGSTDSAGVDLNILQTSKLIKESHYLHLLSLVMGDLRILKAYQISKRLILDCVSEYIKYCCTSMGYLIPTVQQAGRAVTAAQGVWPGFSLCCFYLG